MAVGDHAQKVVNILYLYPTGDLIKALLEVVNVAVKRDEDVDPAGIGGGQDVVVIRIFRAWDSLRIPASEAFRVTA